MQNHCIALNIIPKLKFLPQYAVFLHPFMLFYTKTHKNIRIVYGNKQYCYEEEQPPTKTKRDC